MSLVDVDSIAASGSLQPADRGAHGPREQIGPQSGGGGGDQV